VKRIPIRNAEQEVVAHALVDDSDFDWLNSWRWCQGSKGYVINGELLYLGEYDDEREAARVAADARKIHLPFAVEARHPA
jgi:hypothetical protein